MTDSRESAFLEATATAFAYLEELGLRRSIREEVDRYERFVSVEYAGDVVAVDVGIHAHWFDVHASITDLNSTTPGGGMWALELLAPPEQRDKSVPPRRWSSHMPGDALSELEIREAVQWYASLLRAWAPDVLTGDFTLLEAKEAVARG